MRQVKVERRCKNCGKVQWVYPSHANRPYCSQACYFTDTSPLRRWSVEEDAIIAAQYPDDDVAVLASQLGRTIRAVHTRAERLHIRRSGYLPSTGGVFRPAKYRINELFFDTWSPSMAYILGFVAADGMVTSDGRFSVCSVDSYIVEYIRDAMLSTHPISIEQRKPHHKPLSKLTIHNPRLVQSLKPLNIVPRKTHILQMPKVPHELFGDFLRGYFDGDGYVFSRTVSMYTKAGWPKSKMCQTSFTCASRRMLESVSDRLSQNHDIRPGRLSQDGNGNWVLMYYSITSTQIYQLMYANPGRLYLLRKRQRFEDYLRAIGYPERIIPAVDC